MRQEALEGLVEWMRAMDHMLSFNTTEEVTIVGNNRTWNSDLIQANLDEQNRVQWIKEGF